MFTSGGYRENGDASARATSATDRRRPRRSAQRTTPNGYDYIVELPGGNGQMRLFDPMFCATGFNGHGGSFGAGDHWTADGNAAARSCGPVAITYRLYNTQRDAWPTPRRWPAGRDR